MKALLLHSFAFFSKLDLNPGILNVHIFHIVSAYSGDPLCKLVLIRFVLKGDCLYPT